MIRNFKEDYEKISNRNFVEGHQFQALKIVSAYLGGEQSDKGRELLFHLMDHGVIGEGYHDVLASLVKTAGLYPYLLPDEEMSTSDLLSYEAHRPIGGEDVVLHEGQYKAYLTLMMGKNVVLSAPTSFGKSLLIDVMLMSGRYRNVVVIVPTIALIDETRRRLLRKFGETYKVITHPTQSAKEKNVYVLTQERFLELSVDIPVDFFVIDEFYKLKPGVNGELEPRAISLNKAFLRLLKKKVQFLLIGPNVESVSNADADGEISFEFIRSGFRTVGSETIRSEAQKDKNAVCLEICKQCEGLTLIFCKSVNSVTLLAKYLVENGLSKSSERASAFADWISREYSSDWSVASFLRAGIAVHYGALPRSVAQYLLHLFNEGAVRFLLCTSTIIEGVNTAAKNVVVYDNKIAGKKFDYFTFNNIKGRAGRMFQHRIGRVYILNDEPQMELPLVDIPAVTLPEDMPTTLTLEAESSDVSRLSSAALKKLRYLHAQPWLPLEVIRANSVIDPDLQIALAQKIQEDPKSFQNSLVWSGFPAADQVYGTCGIIFEYLLDGGRDSDVVSAQQMAYKIIQLQKAMPKGFKAYVEEIRQRAQEELSVDELIRTAFSFLRNWAEFKIPQYLVALDRIQKHSFRAVGFRSGDYSVYAESIKHWFRPPAETVLEEYGMPMSMTEKIERHVKLPDSIDEMVESVSKINAKDVGFDSVESDIYDFAFSRRKEVALI